MKSAKSQQQLCLTSLKLLGDFWTLRIIDALRDEEVRYCELQRRLDNLNPVTLTGRLKKLEAATIVIRAEVPDTGSVTYSLTPLGHEALAVISALNGFSAKLKVSV